MSQMYIVINNITINGSSNLPDNNIKSGDKIIYIDESDKTFFINQYPDIIPLYLTNIKNLFLKFPDFTDSYAINDLTLVVNKQNNQITTQILHASNKPSKTLIELEHMIPFHNSIFIYYGYKYRIILLILSIFSYLLTRYHKFFSMIIDMIRYLSI